MSGVSSIKDGFQIAMDLANAANRSGDVAKLIDTQQQVLSVLDDNIRLRARVKELEADLQAVSQLERRGLDYYVVEDDGSSTGPVCPGCYKKDHIVSLVSPQPGHIKIVHAARSATSCSGSGPMRSPSTRVNLTRSSAA